MGKISVCLATYNGEKFIKNQIESILIQLGFDDELIISDNGSTDNTISLINSFNDRRVKIYKFLERRVCGFSKTAHYTISANFENAIKHASGDYIFLADQDDIWLENKVNTTMMELKNVDLVVSNCSIITEDGNISRTGFLKMEMFSKSVRSNVISPRFHGCCMAFRASALSYILPFPKMLILHDSWIGVLISQLGTVKFLDKDLMLYRLHNSNSSNDNGKSKNNIYFKVFYRVVLYVQFLSRILCSKTKIK